ncbi:MAG: hypothetical protein KatS3mg059_1780 [Thermomicrobiales bacterium]|nr:MAG: hypothetical protein KatS3mg059_1780 [Thermomicrobiales bacterium]
MIICRDTSIAELLRGGSTRHAAITDPSLTVDLAVVTDSALHVLSLCSVDQLLHAVTEGGTAGLIATLLDQPAAARKTLLVVGVIGPTAGGVQVDDQVTALHWHAVQGVLLSVQECGVTVGQTLQAGLAAWLTYWVERCARAEQPVVARPARGVVKHDPVAWLSYLPGVGEATARRALEVGGGKVGYALAALTYPALAKRCGIATGAVAKVREFLGLATGEYLGPVAEEE